ncbi:helix-turn-helix domain-containing protein [Amycolatopsis alkalitolerans]|uniref:Helix-turn-helix transcriptional regulator n=1 Tax=Amycolatopsis alkalitolerans TaxID=2547244 RepID=A0A5C4LS51_9PSEU|nr:helix-turn-helix transcriptional regulator [Amycolatopsis alkalitolerans]TNC19080.1 helix-turn-helix transcriptional regulator [Amycolatopsis alkalitolerans]
MTGALTTVGAVPQWTLADRLRKAREHAELHQRELATRLGLSRTSISSYESASVTPKRPVLLAWSMATGVSFDWLAGETEPEPTADLTAISGEPTGRYSLLSDTSITSKLQVTGQLLPFEQRKPAVARSDAAKTVIFRAAA